MEPKKLNPVLQSLQTQLGETEGLLQEYPQIITKARAELQRVLNNQKAIRDRSNELRRAVNILKRSGFNHG